VWMQFVGVSHVTNNNNTERSKTNLVDCALWQVFGTIKLNSKTAINRHNNFRTFADGIMLLFRWTNCVACHNFCNQYTLVYTYKIYALGNDRSLYVCFIHIRKTRRLINVCSFRSVLHANILSNSCEKSFKLICSNNHWIRTACTKEVMYKQV